MSANKINPINEATQGAMKLAATVTKLAFMTALNKTWNTLTTEQREDFLNNVGAYDHVRVLFPYDGSDAILVERDCLYANIGRNNPAAQEYLRILNESIQGIDIDAHAAFDKEVMRTGVDGRYFCPFYSDSDLANVRKEYQEAVSNMTSLIAFK